LSAPLSSIPEHNQQSQRRLEVLPAAAAASLDLEPIFAVKEMKKKKKNGEESRQRKKEEKENGPKEMRKIERSRMEKRRVVPRPQARKPCSLAAPRCPSLRCSRRRFLFHFSKPLLPTAPPAPFNSTAPVPSPCCHRCPLLPRK
jgi:hypothetical protein